MADVKAKVSFDPKGSAVVTIDLIGESEMEHELLAAFFTARSVSLVPFREGDKLQSRFVISDSAAFGLAQRACENRIRVRDGRPTVEQEEEQKAAVAKIHADREAADKAAQALGFKDAADKETKDAAAASRAALAAAIVDEQEKRAKK